MLTGVFDKSALHERSSVGCLPLLDGSVDELKLLLIQSKYHGVVGHVRTSCWDFGGHRHSPVADVDQT